MTDDVKRVPLPTKGRGDDFHVLARAGLSAVPLVGGPLKELLSAVIGPPIERRRDEWMTAVAETLNELQEKYDVLPETLAKSAGFISVVMNASQIAIRTHEKVKL